MFAAARRQFEASFAADVATKIGVSNSRVIITSIAAGSIAVDFYVRPDAAGTVFDATKLASAFSVVGISVAGSKTTAPIIVPSLASTPAPAPASAPTPAASTSTVPFASFALTLVSLCSGLLSVGQY